jgi:hypothetical protein
MECLINDDDDNDDEDELVSMEISSSDEGCIDC